jgi:hypothetical protein
VPTGEIEIIIIFVEVIKIVYMKRACFFIFILCLFYTFPETKAQIWKLRRYEASGGIGPTLFFGDIGGFSKTKNILGIKDMSFLQTRFNLNVSAKYRIAQDINIRLSLSTGLLHATDARGSNEARGFESSTTIFEPSLLGEYYFIKNSNENSYLFTKGQKPGFGGLIRSLDFYVFTGIGGLVYSVNPNDKLASLASKTNGFTAVIPLGIGATLVYSSNLNFGIELGGRYTFSDNLDGYTSQYSSSNDVYYCFNLTFAYKLKTGNNGLPSFRR